ncbi:MAG: DUF1272 domain-containing protein [Gammaproteobacteria bacterium]|nr:DUF1272 domain-containing protein [Gammaproteobacteria bacterium]
MLLLKPNCEHCDRDLLPDAPDARICSFECTFCAECVERVLKNVCPNCAGGLAPRPIRPKAKLRTRPASAERVLKPVDQAAHAVLLKQYESVPPESR